MLNSSRSDAGYRSGEGARSEQLFQLRAEIDRLRSVSPLRRAILPPGTLHELDAISSRIDAVVEPSPTADAVAALDAVAKELAVVVARANREVERVRARPRDVPLPPAPQRFAFGSHKLTFAIEEPFRRQMQRASEVRPYGVGMLAQIEHAATPLVFVARGRRSDHIIPMRKLDAVLRASVPRGPSIKVEPRSFFHQLFRARDAARIEPGFDDLFVTKGDASVAKSLLCDPSIRHPLRAMHGELVVLAVEGGVVDLVWRRPFDRERTAVLPDAAVSIVTSIAKRLYEA